MTLYHFPLNLRLDLLCNNKYKFLTARITGMFLGLFDYFCIFLC